MVESKNIPWLELASVHVQINKRKVLGELDLALYPGENTVILGPNGSGKSLLVRLISRDLYPVVKEGSHMHMFGSDKINLWHLRSRVGFLSTEIEKRSNPYVKAKDLIISGYFGSIGIGKGQNPTETQLDVVSNLINTLELNKCSEMTFGELSDGQKRRILIARALIHNPEILILDEPTNGLDIKSTYQLLELLSDLIRKGKTLLMITHQVETIIKEIDRVVFLSEGIISGDGTVEEKMTSSELSNLFDTRLNVIKDNDFYRLVHP